MLVLYVEKWMMFTPLPHGNFGKLWCTNSSNTTTVIMLALLIWVLSSYLFYHSLVQEATIEKVGMVGTFFKATSVHLVSLVSSSVLNTQLNTLWAHYCTHCCFKLSSLLYFIGLYSISNRMTWLHNFSYRANSFENVKDGVVI